MKIQLKWFVHKDANVCHISRELFDTLHLLQNKIYSLHIGLFSGKVYVKPIEIRKNCIFISPLFFSPQFSANELIALDDATLNLWILDDELHIGPVMGYLVTSSRIQKLEEGGIIQRHMQAGLTENFLFYCFSKNNIDWQNKKIKGLTYSTELQQWIFGWFPFPDVVYDQEARNPTAKKSMVRDLRIKLRSVPDIQFINKLDSLSKWEMYQQLGKSSLIKKYLPDTIVYTCFSDVLAMLKKYKFIFLKACYGSRGRQVLSVKKVNNRYQLVYFRHRLRQIEIKNKAIIKKKILRFMRDRAFLIQQGIPLLTYQGHHFDLRVMTLKDRRGEWIATKHFARIAKGNFTITNYSAGGYCEFYHTIHSYLKPRLPLIELPDGKQVEAVAVEIARAIDQEFGPFGELGIDIAIDTYGKLWFIEANLKPDKTLSKRLNDSEGIHPQYLTLFKYAKFLCGIKE